MLPNDQPVPLINGIQSHQNFEDVKKLIRLDTRKWSIIEDSGLAKNDSRPRFDIRTLEIKNFIYASVPGTLRLEFFNDQLTESTFYPQDFEKSKQVLSNRLGFDIGKKIEQRIAGAVVYTSKDFNDRRYITWQDESLAEEEKKWIRNHS